MDELWFVRPYDFLHDFNSHAEQELYEIGLTVSINKDQLIFSAGSPGEYVYILLEGRIKIYELTSDGKEVIHWFCFPGELFGLAEIVRGGRRTVAAQACSKVKLLKIKHSDFVNYMQKYPDVALRIIGLLSCRLRELGDVITNLVADDVTARVMKLLTRLGARYGSDEGKEVRLNICLTHQEMADMIGTTRQTVTTVLSSLKRKDLLRIENKIIYIQNNDWINSIVDGKIIH
ncbi:hypothetical protein MNBD_GAMMA12-106 [hydrothermal vent metagenome]|uniref:cAMP-binding proteins - catabolite gene activator and regulatory subunit of cAMP-dependent protein kinases n=1 Tax=hydrothermal vent metagenome TaxID=652676 RepID=A0A3B0Z3N3_9ZZZZ